MTLFEFKNYFFKNLKSINSQNEIEEFFFWLIEHHCNINRMGFMMNSSFKLSIIQTNNLFKSISLLKKNTPIQYVIGETEFMNLKFKLNNKVLIPRPETEELVSWVINDNNENKRILDIGTGSGCIAISLAKFIKNSNVIAWDVDKKILSIANKNAIMNNVKILFELIDISKVKPDRKFDIIISNPPYVCENEKSKMKDNVLLFEPHLALFVNDNDPLFFYSRIVDFARLSLNNRGKLFLEINENYSERVVKLLKNAEFQDIELRKDIRQKNRMIKACFK